MNSLFRLALLCVGLRLLPPGLDPVVSMLGLPLWLSLEPRSHGLGLIDLPHVPEEVVRRLEVLDW